MSEELLTARELKEKLKVSLAAVRAWTRQGLPCRKLGTRTVRFEIAAVLAWLERRGSGAEVDGAPTHR